jgi:hypothetical protein
VHSLRAVSLVWVALSSSEFCRSYCEVASQRGSDSWLHWDADKSGIAWFRIDRPRIGGALDQLYVDAKRACILVLEIFVRYRGVSAQARLPANLVTLT